MARWGLIGASTIASEWVIDAIRANPDQTIEGVLSRSAERGRDYAVRHGVARSWTDLGRFLEEGRFDAVYISTTNEKHREECLAAAGAGAHVLCEKPLALTVRDALAMVEACRKAGVVMATNHHLRCSATHRAVRDLVAQGRIGKPIAARVFHAVYLPPHLQGWRIDAPETGAGVILDITVHDADTLRFVLGEDPVDVVAESQSAGLAQGGIEDGVMTVMRFASGLIAHTHESFTVRYAGTGLEVHGEKGSIRARDVMTQRPIGTVELTDENGTTPIPVDHVNLYAYGVARFIQAMEGRGTPAATGEDGVKSLAVALAVAGAARTGRRTAVDYGGL